MKPFVYSGVFWLPTDEERSLPGTLAFDGRGLQLVLREPLRGFTLPEERSVRIRPRLITEPLMFGRLFTGGPGDLLAESRLVTLRGVLGVSHPGPWLDVRESYEVDFAILDTHSMAQQTASIRISFDALDAWAHPPPLVSELDGDPQVFIGDARSQVLAEAFHDGLTYRLMTTVDGEWGDHIHLDRRTWFEIESATQALELDGVLARVIRPIHDLLLVAIGEPVALTEIRLEIQRQSGRAFATMVTGALQATPRDGWEAASLRNYDSSAWLLPSDPKAPFEKVLPIWLDRRSAIDSVVTLLTAPFYTPSMYGDWRYSSTFQAAEALAKQKYSTRDLPSLEHRARVAAIVEAAKGAGVEIATVEWAQRVLASRNDRSLRELIQQLVDETGALGSAITEALGDPGRVMASARTGVSHGGTTAGIAVPRGWLGRLLAIVVRVHLLLELGVPLEGLEGRVLNSSEFRRAIRNVSR